MNSLLDFGKTNSLELVMFGTHTFQLAIKSFLKLDEKIVLNVRSINKSLRKPSTKRELESFDINTPTLDNDTRWFSSYIMIQNFYQCREYIRQKGCSVAYCF